MGLDSSVGLIVATLDLQLVRLVRAAMQSKGAGGGGGAIHPQPVIEPRRRFHPEPKIEPRRHIHPEPSIHPALPEPNGPVRPRVWELSGAAPADPLEKIAHSPSPIQPPWKIRPWEACDDCDRARPVRKVKVIEARPDIRSKGSVIDLFI